MMYRSRDSLRAALPIASALLTCALAACGTSSECPSGDARVNLDAVVATGDSGALDVAAADVGTDAAAGSLGTPGAYFAGTACHCETTTTAQETVLYTEEGAALIASRTSDGTTCTVQQVTMNQPTFVMRSNGVAERQGGPPYLAAGIAFGAVGTWRCVQGTFRLDFPTHTQTGDLTRQVLIAPPQCQLFPCAPGLRCSISATLASRNSCIADGSLAQGVSCNEDANCQSGLTCQSTSAVARECR
jgi:hypothetical protein